MPRAQCFKKAEWQALLWMPGLVCALSLPAARAAFRLSARLHVAGTGLAALGAVCCIAGIPMSINSHKQNCLVLLTVVSIHRGGAAAHGGGQQRIFA